MSGSGMIAGGATNAGGGAAIDRIVVLLDAAADRRAALDTGARLAARWGARLHGVFIEDEDLLRLATLPFARQFSLHGGAEALTVAGVEDQLRAFAEQARRDLLAAARRHRVEATFDVVRGAAASAAPGDFVVACRLTRPIGGHFQMECRVWPAPAAAPASFLLAQRGWDRDGGVLALIEDQGAASARVVEAAARLADAAGSALTVACPPAVAQSVGFDAWLAGHIAGHGGPVSVELMPPAPAALVRRVVEMNCRIVAIAATDGAPPAIFESIASISCDLLMVR